MSTIIKNGTIVTADMLMRPCVCGPNYNEAEEISPEWAAAGTDVLLHAVLEVAGVVG